MRQEQGLRRAPSSAAAFHSYFQFFGTELDTRAGSCCRFMTRVVGVGVNNRLFLLGEELHDVDTFALKLRTQSRVFILQVMVEALKMMKPCFHFALARGLVHLEDTREWNQLLKVLQPAEIYMETERERQTLGRHK